MAKLITMETRYKRVILVGEVTETILAALREQVRREKILDAFQRTQEVTEGDRHGTLIAVSGQPASHPDTTATKVTAGNTAPEIRGNPRRTTEGEPARGSGFSGKLNR